MPMAALVTLRLCLIIHSWDDYDCYDLHVISLLCRAEASAGHRVLMASVLASYCDVSLCAEDRVDMEYDCYCSLSDIPSQLSAQ